MRYLDKSIRFIHITNLTIIATVVFSTQISIPLVQAQSTTQQIIVDQFGWRTNAHKTVVFANPVTGQNSSNTYTPGSSFQVRRSSDNTVVFSGNTVVWNSGNTHTDSGDQAWHGDFSSVTAPGTYHIYDPTRNLRSYDFDIRDNIYAPVLQSAIKVFYYQRSGTAITAQHGGNWTHALAHNQDANALLYSTSAQPGTTHNVMGGWYDAGDYNKYIPYLAGPMWDLMMAYEQRPAAFTDATNIPESGNGVPDVLDELKWELDWMLRMQDANGGVYNRVTVTSHDNGTDDPSTDTQPRYYTNVTTWSTATFAAIMAHGSRVFSAYGTQFPNYANTLRIAAENAWTYLEGNPNMNPTTGKDGATMAATDAGSNANEDRRLRILASAQLFRTTGTTKYKTYFESNYSNTSATSENNFHPLSSGYMDASLCWDLNQAFIIYWGTPGADGTIASQLKNTLKNTMDWFHEPKYNQKADPYLAYMLTGHYTWGSNELKARWGQLAILALENNVNPPKNSLYREIAEEYLHYFHGRNPLSWVYLSNMGARGANVGGDKNVEEFFHSWFRNGSSRYDGPGSQFGPAPGYVVGGPNATYSGTTSPPKGNPPMKSFAAWNADYPDPSWEVTEPAIYYQGAYVFLASYFTEPASGTNIIYDDALKTSWLDYSWGTNRNVSDNTPVQSGSKSISVTYTEAYGGLYLHTGSPVFLTGFSHLKFWVNGGKTGNQKIIIKVNGDETNTFSLTIPAKNWTLVTIPFTLLGNPTSLTKLYFQEGLGSTKQPEFNIDQIYLANSATAREGVGLSQDPPAELEPEVKVYPNPIDAHTGALTLQFIGFEQNEEVRLTLNDLYGRKMHQIRERLTTPEKQLSVGRLTPGYYFIQIQTKSKHLSQKVLVR